MPWPSHLRLRSEGEADLDLRARSAGDLDRLSFLSLLLHIPIHMYSVSALKRGIMWVIRPDHLACMVILVIDWDTYLSLERERLRLRRRRGLGLRRRSRDLLRRLHT